MQVGKHAGRQAGSKQQAGRRHEAGSRQAAGKMSQLHADTNKAANKQPNSCRGGTNRALCCSSSSAIALRGFCGQKDASE
jgi:hypothetical protein